jgi:hypothetical protein
VNKEENFQQVKASHFIVPPHQLQAERARRGPEVEQHTSPHMLRCWSVCVQVGRKSARREYVIYKLELCERGKG